MSDGTIYEHLLRLGRLLDAEDRRVARGLQPVQVRALQYLDRCNRYSDRPAAVAEYLAVTKGTASQTLGVLREKGLVTKQVDPADRRQVRLGLTAKGRRLARAVDSRRLLEQVLADLPAELRRRLAADLESTLRATQRRHGGRSFGLCHTCRHFRREPGNRFRCGLTGEPLKTAESELICREHEAADDLLPS